MRQRSIKAPHVLSEAYEYDKPVPFSRGTRIDIKGVTILLISGIASVNEKGESIHQDDFEAQARRMLKNVTELLKSESASWCNVVRTTFFIKHIEKHYHDLASVRMRFFEEHGITEYPASTCVQANLCRPELLVEMEAIAIMESVQ